MSSTPPHRTRSEPFFNALQIALILPVLVLVTHGLFQVLPEIRQQFVLYSSVLSPDRFFSSPEGRYAYEGLVDRAWPFIGSALLHMDWSHAIMNAAMILAAGAAVAMWTGVRGFQAAVFWIIVLVSQVAAGFAHLFAHFPDGVGAVGASGIASGLVGAAILTLLARRNRISSIKLLTAQNGVILIGFVIINFILAGAFEASTGVGIAWQAHIGGFVGGAVALRFLAPRPLARRG